MMKGVFVSSFVRVFDGGILDLEKHLSNRTLWNNLLAKLSGTHNLWEMVYDSAIDDCLYFLTSPAKCRLVSMPYIP